MHPNHHANGWPNLQDYAKVILDPHFTDLKREGISLTKYYAHTHPSQPNYLASIAGDYFGLNHDHPVYIPENVSTVVDILETKGISWGGYFEDQPGPGFMGVASKGSSGTEKWDYVRKHKYETSLPDPTPHHARNRVRTLWLTHNPRCEQPLRVLRVHLPQRQPLVVPGLLS